MLKILYETIHPKKTFKEPAFQVKSVHLYPNAHRYRRVLARVLCERRIGGHRFFKGDFVLRHNIWTEVFTVDLDE